MDGVGSVHHQGIMQSVILLEVPASCMLPPRCHTCVWASAHASEQVFALSSRRPDPFSEQRCLSVELLVEVMQSLGTEYGIDSEPFRVSNMERR